MRKTMTMYIRTDTVYKKLLSQVALCSGVLGFCDAQMMTAFTSGQVIEDAGIRLMRNLWRPSWWMKYKSSVDVYTLPAYSHLPNVALWNI